MTEEERTAVWNEAVVACSKSAWHFKEPFKIVLFGSSNPVPEDIAREILKLAKPQAPR